MTFLFNVWVSAGGHTPFAFTEAELQAFKEPAEFTKFAEERGASKAQQRFEWLRALRPSGNGVL